MTQNNRTQCYPGWFCPSSTPEDDSQHGDAHRDTHPTLISCPLAAAVPEWTWTETIVSAFFSSVAFFANGCKRKINKMRRGRENSCSSGLEGHKSASRWQILPAGQIFSSASFPLSLDRNPVAFSARFSLASHEKKNIALDVRRIDACQQHTGARFPRQLPPSAWRPPGHEGPVVAVVGQMGGRDWRSSSFRAFGGFGFFSWHVFYTILYVIQNLNAYTTM